MLCVLAPIIPRRSATGISMRSRRFPGSDTTKGCWNAESGPKISLIFLQARVIRSEFSLQLDRPGDGIHGAPNAATIGRAGSHGCIRLANWDAALIRNLATVGTPVSIQ